MKVRIGTLVLLFAAILVSGCTESGPKRFRVSGEAKFNGQPIPYGDVLITPDMEKQNSGPQAIATIINGKFDTSASDGKGYGGGPAVVRVTGLDKQGGKLLCEYEYKVDLPKSDAPLNIEVPASAAKKPGGGDI